MPQLTAFPPIAVCVPVRNEAARLPALLAALAAQRRPAGAPVTLCFGLDGCTDASARVIREAVMPRGMTILLQEGPAHAQGNAGRARRAAMAMGEAAMAERIGALLLTTDGDSMPAPDWIAAAVTALVEADVAAGRVVRDDAGSNPLQARMEAYLDRLHGYRRAIDPVAWDPLPGHHWAAGANIAIRADAYAALGGFRPLPSGEDAVLLDDAARAGFRVRRDPAMIVTTSARRTGRAPDGLAAALRRLDRGCGLVVSHPADAAWQYRAHAAARTAFARSDDPGVCARLGAVIGLSAAHVLGVARDCPNAEAFAMCIVPTPPHPIGPVPLADAEMALAALELAICEQAA